jgi:hypothetical protein
VSLKGSILAGYVQQLKNRRRIQPVRGIYDVVIATFKRGVKGG